MARFFFDIYDGDEICSDDTGMELETLEKVRYEAIDVLPEIAREELPDGDSHVMWVKVRDDRDRYVFEASLTLATKWLGD